MSHLRKVLRTEIGYGEKEMLSEEFIEAIYNCLDASMTPQQVCAFIRLIGSVRPLCKLHDPEVLASRAFEIACIRREKK